ncbi:MAG TPA: PilZ domain-containing protein [Vicinamibacteria bacterium]|nr:PilZ domain-containing protein [Vicinamibacteria bacterium]
MTGFDSKPQTRGGPRFRPAPLCATIAPASMSSGERRRDTRHGMRLAVRVLGHLPGGATWDELTDTDDVSPGGASLSVKRSVELGQVLHLSLALPKRLRQYDLDDRIYRVYALVRGIVRRPDDQRVGVMFFGKFPPRGFREKPWARYLLPSDGEAMAAAQKAAASADAAPDPAPRPDSDTVTLPASTLFASPFEAAPAPAPDVPAERRTHPRYSMFLNLTIQQVDEWGAVLQEELTVADNLSRGGAHVLTTLDFSMSDVILLQEADGSFATRAEVRAVLEGPDGIVRLHLRFLDRELPARLLKG